MEELTRPQARRITLAAQGFNAPHPDKVGMRQITGLLDRLSVIHFDSINILERSHQLPFFSRLGRIDPTLVNRALTKTPRRALENWGHESSMVNPEVYHLLEWRRAGADTPTWERMGEVAQQHPLLIKAILKLIADTGPLTSGQISAKFEDKYPSRPPDQWGWSWSPAAAGLEWLFYTGQVAVASRDGDFSKRYDLAERIVPPLPEVPSSPQDQIRALVERAAKARGVASRSALRDYFDLPTEQTNQAIDQLVESGDLSWVQIERIDEPWLLHSAAAQPAKVEAQSLLAPFDPLVFDRPTIQALFGMRFRLEFYIPRKAREYGYYVLPFLLGDQLVARVDLTPNNRLGKLVVQGAFLEPGQQPDQVVDVLRQELVSLSIWLRLGLVVRGKPARGDLIPHLFNRPTIYTEPDSEDEEEVEWAPNPSYGIGQKT